MDNKASKPVIAFTMGDPAGIGPEVIVKAFKNPEVGELCRPVIYGDLGVLQKTADWLDVPFTFEAVNNPRQIPAEANKVAVVQATGANLENLKLGELNAEAGRAAVESVLAAGRAALAGEVDAIVTAPLNKEAMKMAGYTYPGHTEMLAELCGVEKFGMLLLSGPLRVVHVSTHVSLRQAIERVKTARVLEVIKLGDKSARALGIARPKVAVAGLNPHAGEGGLFGDEEKEIIPAIEQAQKEGINAIGPLPPDTVFARTASGEFDLVVAMYHDQGHIPVKLHGFDTGVNATIGLPIIRTSVDHGTAFDIAGKGIAREASVIEALRAAVQMVKARSS
jgi:4-hydroxythreonine-4-phosphate dehydrogenase